MSGIGAARRHGYRVRMTEQDRRRCPLCNRAVTGPFRPGPGGRPDAACPHCGSLERHRFLAILLSGMATDVAMAGLVLDVAPSTFTSRLLSRLGARHVVGMDFDPDADGRHVDIQASLTDVPLPDGSVDLLLCYHVLEHIPDDRAAMAEIARVLSPGGTALVQVPWRPSTTTDEDPSADEATRLARFGQADHVRMYGSDFEQRLTDAGLNVLRIHPRDYLAEDVCRVFHVDPDEAVWCLRRVPEGSPGTVRTLGNHQLTNVRDPRIRALRAEVKQLKKRLSGTQANYERLRNRLPIRLAAAVRNGMRRDGSR